MHSTARAHTHTNGTHIERKPLYHQLNCLAFWNLYYKMKCTREMKAAHNAILFVYLLKSVFHFSSSLNRITLNKTNRFNSVWYCGDYVKVDIVLTGDSPIQFSEYYPLHTRNMHLFFICDFKVHIKKCKLLRSLESARYWKWVEVKGGGNEKEHNPKSSIL